MYNGTNTEIQTYNKNISAAVSNILTDYPMMKGQVRCYDCNLDFTSQIVLDAHLQGARHAKQVRSKTLLETLQKDNVGFSEDKQTNSLKCNACSVYLNSIQQLHTHLNGNRHKKRMEKGDWNGKEVISKTNASEIPPNILPKPAVKDSLLSCQPCNKFFNSQSQLDVHLSSLKHSDKINGTKKGKKKRFNPYARKKNTGIINAVQTPITSSFVSGGFTV